MISSFRSRIALIAAALFAIGLVPVAARAALDMADGTRKVVDNEPRSACNSRAASALKVVLGSALEVGEDSGEWEAYGPPGVNVGPAAAAAVHCYPVGSGYLVTFTCAVELPYNPDPASALCTKLEAAFDAAKLAAIVPQAGR